MANRRQFIKTLAFVGLGLLVKTVEAAGKVVKGKDSKSPDPRAKNFNYYEDVSKAPKNLVKGKKPMAKGKPVQCSTCALYSADAKKGYGKCAPFFQADLVSDKGFCPTWSPKG